MCRPVNTTSLNEKNKIFLILLFSINFSVPLLYLVDIMLESRYNILMGKRGAKLKFTYVSCPNKNCKLYGITGQGNIVGNGTYQISNKRVRKYICRECGRVFNDRTDTFFENLHKDESVIESALKMSIKGMSIEAIAEILEVRPATISNWLFRAAKQCEKVNEYLMKDLNVFRVEMDELWVIVEKKSHQGQKLRMKEPGCG